MTVDKERKLPSEAADELLTHLSTCPQCKRVRRKHGRRGAHCEVAKELLRQTLKERHE
jgi:hypothetical protein